MKFYSRSDRCECIPHPVCDFDEPVYFLATDERGLTCLQEQQGVRKPTYAMIQESVGPSVKEIVRRASLGDYSLIGSVKESYQDFVGAPRSLAEVHEFLKKSVDTFNDLPVDVKQLFDNSANSFRQSVQDGTIDTKIKSYLNKQVKSQKNYNKEVVENESK